MDDPFIPHGRARHRVGRTHGMGRMPPSLERATPSGGGHSLLPRSVSASAGGRLAIHGRDPPSWSIGDPLTRRDTPIQDDGCIHQARSAPAIAKRMHPSRRGGHPYGLKDAAKWHEGCTHPAIADTHRASWPWASRHEDVPSGPEACGHAACWTSASSHTEVPFRELRTPP